MKQIPDCAKGGCVVRSDFSTSASGTPLHFALVRVGPKETDGVEDELKMALFDAATQELTWLSPMIQGLLDSDARQLAAHDSIGHIAVTVYVGAHSSMLYVIDPADGVNVRFIGPEIEGGSGPRAWFSVTPGAHAEDLDGDGVFELVVPVNDYEPSYAEGTTTVYRHRWNGREYVDAGCTVLARGAVAEKDYPAGDPTCGPA